MSTNSLSNATRQRRVSGVMPGACGWPLPAISVACVARHQSTVATPCASMRLPQLVALLLGPV
eukprot:scaffold952_cov409-Prasinococcus_capsulatus_cf.AAC.10